MSLILANQSQPQYSLCWVFWFLGLARYGQSIRHHSLTANTGADHFLAIATIQLRVEECNPGLFLDAADCWGRALECQNYFCLMHPHHAIHKNQAVYWPTLKAGLIFLSYLVQPNAIRRDENQLHCEWGYKVQSIECPILDRVEIDLGPESAYPLNQCSHARA